MDDPRVIQLRDEREARRQLLRELGCVVAPAAADEDEAVPPRELDVEAIRDLRRRVRENPELWKPTPPHILGSQPTEEAVDRLLSDVEDFLADPMGSLAEHRETRAATDEPFPLPERCQFDGYDPVGIPIQMGRTDMQDGDYLGWAVSWAASRVYALRHRKPRLPQSAHDFTYDLRSRDDVATVGLFGDWATGYYHSRYIAKHLASMAPDQAIHLGDVYYAGSPRELGDHLAAPLDGLLAQCPVYLMNANHEMMHEGIPYLDFIRAKHDAARQPQESTYFCLRNTHYQVIGIDTAFHESGRHPDTQIQGWLMSRLAEGRREKKINILLSQNEPYSKGMIQKLLSADLREAVLEQKLVDLWFWGDEHYCALYGPGAAAPFIGCCIGHGGYPYPRRTRQELEPPLGVATLLWGETAARFPKHIARSRQDVGNNGFCWMELKPLEVALTFYDWRRQIRYAIRIAVKDGGLILPEVLPTPSSEEGTCNHG